MDEKTFNEMNAWRVGRTVQEMRIVELLLDYEQGNEHFCPECGKDSSGGRQYHEPSCKLRLALEQLNAPEEWC